MFDFWRFIVPRRKNTTPFVSPRRTEFLDYDPDLACGRRTTSTMIGKAEKTWLYVGKPHACWVWWQWWYMMMVMMIIRIMMMTISEVFLIIISIIIMMRLLLLMMTIMIMMIIVMMISRLEWFILLGLSRWWFQIAWCSPLGKLSNLTCAYF